MICGLALTEDNRLVYALASIFLMALKAFQSEPGELQGWVTD